jgi:Basic region leucine zipper
MFRQPFHHANSILHSSDFQFTDYDNLDGVLGQSIPPLDGAQNANLNGAVSSSSAGSPQYSEFSSTGAKRKSSSANLDGHPEGMEEMSRVAAEEDKRRRNTAASARFRVKKKQREQALEQTAKVMTDKCNGLEARITQLEMENKWLKNLITEKNETKDDVAELWRKFNREQNANVGERSTPARKDGVGTKAGERK